MKLKTLVKIINPALQGTSRTSGNPYKVQEVVLEWQEPASDGNLYPQRVMATLFNQSVDNLAALNPVAGQTVIDVDLQFSTRTGGNGRVFTEITGRV